MTAIQPVEAPAVARSDRPVRVLHVVTWQSPGGIAMWLLNMLRTVPRQQWEMDLAYNRRSTPELLAAAAETGARTIACPLTPLVLGFVRSLRRVVREGRYDLVHAHLDGYNGLAVLAVRGLGVPVVCTYHSTSLEPRVGWMRLFPLRQLRALLLRGFVRYAARHATLVTAVSQAALDEMLRRCPQARDRARVLPLGVPAPAPLPAARRAELRAGWGVPLAAPLVVHVGRFTVEKNHLGALDVFQRVHSELPSAHLVFLGEGPLEDAVRQAAARRGLADCVHLAGHQAQAGELIQACDAFLFPSFHEGLPLAVLEAQAGGVPVVASRIRGTLEAVKEGVTAILHDVNDAASMADSLLRVLREPELARRLAAAGRAWHTEHFTVAAAAERLMGLYRDCLSEMSL